MHYKIAVLPGDGIGQEVTGEGVQVLRLAAQRAGFSVEFEEGLVGGASIDVTGRPLTDSVLHLARQSDAILLGAVGGPKWEGLAYSIRPERALLRLREELGLYANLRPVHCVPPLADASTLKRNVIEGIDLMVIRELTGDVYFATPKGVFPDKDGERAVNTMAYTTREVKRIAELAFDVARTRKRKVTSVDKANILESSELWRKVVGEVHREYPDIDLNHLYVDNCAMQLIRSPMQFDVILTTNLFGDILSDEAAMLTGSIGMLPSASLGGRVGMYEPVHGSAPDIAGKDIANPLATILSVAMMLRYSFGQTQAAQSVERAVETVLEEGFRTQDLMDSSGVRVGCRAMGRLVREKLRSEES
jgi:3-isopropylmalate dehydrogenase